MAPFHLWSKVCIASFQVRSKFAVFARHIKGSNADFAPHMEGSHADFALHIERRNSFRDQKISKITISDIIFLQTTYILKVYMNYLTPFHNENILRENAFKGTETHNFCIMI